MPDRTCEIDVAGLAAVLVWFFLYFVLDFLAQVR